MTRQNMFNCFAQVGTCVARDANPAAAITWKKNGKILVADGKGNNDAQWNQSLVPLDAVLPLGEGKEINSYCRPVILKWGHVKALQGSEMEFIFSSVFNFIILLRWKKYFTGAATGKRLGTTALEYLRQYKYVIHWRIQLQDSDYCLWDQRVLDGVKNTKKFGEYVPESKDNHKSLPKKQLRLQDFSVIPNFTQSGLVWYNKKRLLLDQRRLNATFIAVAVLFCMFL